MEKNPPQLQSQALSFIFERARSCLIFQRALPLEDHKVYGKLLKEHWGQVQEQQRPWSPLNSWSTKALVIFESQLVCNVLVIAQMIICDNGCMLFSPQFAWTHALIFILLLVCAIIALVFKGQVSWYQLFFHPPSICWTLFHGKLFNSTNSTEIQFWNTIIFFSSLIFSPVSDDWLRLTFKRLSNHNQGCDFSGFF